MAWNEDPRESFNELIDTPLDFSVFVMNQLKVDTLTPELLVGLTFKLMKGSCKSLVELEYFLEEVCKATTDQLDWNNPEGQQYPHDLHKPLPLIPNSRGRRVIPFDHFINNDLAYLSGYLSLGRKRQQFYGFAVNRESARDVYSRYRIIAITKLTIVEWHNYKHLDWIAVRRDDDKLYTFKEGDYKRLRLQDIEDMLLLLVQGKLKNLTIEERLALSVSLRISQRKVNIYSILQSQRFHILEQRQDEQIDGIDELHKFSDGTLDDVQTALKDHLKGIRMEKRRWSPQDKRRARVMISAIDRKLRDRRLMRSLEKFVGGRPYGGDLRLLERTI
ncbi:hypothetical protein Tco_0308042 [Tanacetum coccineum]